MKKEQTVESVIEEALCKLDKNHSYFVESFSLKGERVLRVIKRTTYEYNEEELKNIHFKVAKFLAIKNVHVKRGLVTTTEFSSDNENVYVDEKWFFRCVLNEKLFPTIYTVCIRS